MRNASAVFDTLPQARAAVRDLLSQGFQKEQINVLANAGNDEVAYEQAEAAGHTAEHIAEAGVAAGGIGGLLVGLSFLAVPGIGPILAAGGLLASVVSGSALGALAGGVVALLVEAGIPQEHASEYAEAIRRGGTLVVVHCSDEQLEQAVAILTQQQPLNLESRVQRWREGGWSNHDAAAAPYTPEQIALEREQAVATQPLIGSARVY
jgi:uncharacterized membrane protein